MLAAETLAMSAMSAASNRLSATRAFWRAYDCAARARAAIDAVLSDGNGGAQRSWRVLNRLVATGGEYCDVTLEAAGTRLDVNEASEAQLHALIRVTSPGEADALTSTLLDWRDADRIPRALGAEWEWYDTHGLGAPRDGPFADAREIRWVRGFESGEFDRLLTVGPARLSLNTAPLGVLASVPGLSEEMLLRIDAERASGRPVVDLLSLSVHVSPQAQRELIAHYPDIVRLTTVDPDAWVLRAEGRDGSPVVSAFIEIRLVRVGGQSAVMSWRSW
jgi:type II secretory pathway component PulK